MIPTWFLVNFCPNELREFFPKIYFQQKFQCPSSLKQLILAQMWNNSGYFGRRRPHSPLWILYYLVLLEHSWSPIILGLFSPSYSFYWLSNYWWNGGKLKRVSSISVVNISWINRKESLTVLREMGIQLETVYYSGKRTNTFIEKQKIKSIIINEAIKSMDVVVYMAFILEGKTAMTLAFQVRTLCHCY